MIAHNNKTKIIATVGPACNTREQLKEMVHAGVNVFRLNFSHGTHEDHRKVVEHIRSLNKELNTHASVLQDLQGPKIRIDEVENGSVPISPGDQLIITSNKMLGNSKQVSTTYTSLPQDVKVNDTILIDDGNIELEVTQVKGDNVLTKVIHGNALKSRKGMNLPDTVISSPSLTDKDKADLAFGIEMDVDWIALSFVRKADDIHQLKEIIAESKKMIRVVAKIEKPEAIRNINEIIAATDALMVARGDLGVEIAMEEVPLVQKNLAEKCNHASIPVIIATQMMESMIENPRPTRAETNDVANAVMDGADCIMLSAETAAGKFPLQTVKSMLRTIMAVEENTEVIYNKNSRIDKESPTFNNDQIVLSACRLAEETQSTAILGMTKSGYTGARLSGHRPKADIFIFTHNEKLLNIINLYWGVRGYFYNKMARTDETFDDIAKIVAKDGFLKKGDTFITTASMPIHWENRTNMLKINVHE